MQNIAERQRNNSNSEKKQKQKKTATNAHTVSVENLIIGKYSSEITIIRCRAYSILYNTVSF